MAKVALCLIATGGYRRFVRQCIESVHQYFLPGFPVTTVLFSDVLQQPQGVDWVEVVPHYPWPGPTLYRYRTMLTVLPRLRDEGHTHLYYCDIDARCVDYIGSEILGELVATLHQGALQDPGLQKYYEMRPESTAHIAVDRGIAYYAGGFQGGTLDVYGQAMRRMNERIKQDERCGITARWHDESHWNCYLAGCPPTVVLPPTYCVAEQDMLPDPKIMVLNVPAKHDPKHPDNPRNV